MVQCGYRGIHPLPQEQALKKLLAYAAGFVCYFAARSVGEVLGYSPTLGEAITVILATGIGFITVMALSK
jgi:hypothetical protein